MFEVDPERSWVDPGAGSITALIQSLNTPLVAAGQHPPESVQSWILTRGAAASATEVFVFFHLTESNQAVLYRWDGGPVPGANQEQVVEEAMGFCESMGFMMDNLNFGQLPPDKRGELLQTLPPFVQDLTTLQKEVEEIPLSMSKKIVDPVEEFARARAAAAGQPTANDFADPSGGDQQFDPMSLMDDVGVVRGDASIPGEDMQIEITEIDGLELLPAADPVPVKAAPPRMQSSVRELDLDLDEPPLVVGSANTPAAKPVVPAAPPAPPITRPKVEPPPARARERTPPGEVTLFDDSTSAAPPMAAKASTVEEEFNVDDLLADVDLARGATNGAAEKSAAPAASSAVDIDVSSALDDILDGVESSKAPAKAPAAPAAPPVAAKAPAPPAAPAKPPAPPAEEISLDIDLEGSLESSISSPDEALVALEALGVSDDPLAALGTMLDDPPAPPVTAGASAPTSPVGFVPSRPAVEAAWAEAPKANGNGARNGAGALPPPLRLDISTDELARLLSML